MSASAHAIGDAPPEEGSFGPNISFLERLLAAVTPDFAASFLWDLANMYIWVLFARRLDAMIEQWTDFYFPLPGRDARPAGGNEPAEGNGQG
ncbi:hypothetical protein E8E15_003576 [Penicillium rubens]|uniref:Uncharacterized protein n=1 Tax=Penicillium chrysogenum TaxID=5076 RepID=A0A167VED8_PENCH|nr:uncharacterized protein N7525_004024 [Penicillium rubens]KAF3017939.1 hypothetical protein E8E15_003576 [Penicillium rubens]KAJ5045164.1 hypothetical protein NUH16_001976 [Penicillium rubens]KAJ5838836.1 hypothetical protein N7525_004024 [Penicillium rubens]KZN90351.1 hypothetical protein EN45_004680 [Penicillium chrysogenum]